MSSNQDIVVGIDLGTTNSVVAAVVDGQAKVLEENGETILPSVVGFNPQGQLITGVVARNQLAVYPERTVASIKRRMGTMDPVPLGDEQFSPPEISAMLLRRLRDRASLALGQPVTRAVITVPAFFDEHQRQATREAGQLAGLVIERIINEPTAATLVYHAGEHTAKQILVYDFGGGTFDVSVVRMEAGVVEVLTSKGDTHLGGDDLDQALLNFVAEQFLAKSKVDLRENTSTKFRLLRACEHAKCQLSTLETVQIVEEFIAEKDGQPLHLNMPLSRDKFEELISPFVERTIECVDAALRDTQLTVAQLDDLVLVGGSTRIPLVEQRLRAEFKREPSRAVDPDLAVALGAAVQAAMIQGMSVGPVLVDVTPHTLGIEVCDGFSMSGPNLETSHIIHRNSPLPARYEHAYSTVFEDQKAADIHILQGEYSEVHRNRSIGRFTLDLEQAGGGKSKILVRFDLTLDGTLEVTATQPSTGVSKRQTINNALSQFQADDRQRAAKRLDSLFEGSDEMLDRQWLTATTPVNDAPNLPEANAFETQYPDAVNLIRRAASLHGSVGTEDAQEMNSLSERLQQAMAAGDDETVANLSIELDDLLFYVQ